jgi:hypothetical protein
MRPVRVCVNWTAKASGVDAKEADASSASSYLAIGIQSANGMAQVFPYPAEKLWDRDPRTPTQS